MLKAPSIFNLLANAITPLLKRRYKKLYKTFRQETEYYGPTLANYALVRGLTIIPKKGLLVFSIPSWVVGLTVLFFLHWSLLACLSLTLAVVALTLMIVLVIKINTSENISPPPVRVINSSSSKRKQLLKSCWVEVRLRPHLAEVVRSYRRTNSVISPYQNFPLLNSIQDALIEAIQKEPNAVQEVFWGLFDQYEEQELGSLLDAARELNS